MEFSPDGGRVAGVSLGNVIHIWSADGSRPGRGDAARRRSATSRGPPTGPALAALTGDFGNTPHSIYVIPLATRVPALVYTDASTSRINLENGISWQPGGTKILFTSNLPAGRRATSRNSCSRCRAPVARRRSSSCRPRPRATRCTASERRSGRRTAPGSRSGCRRTALSPAPYQHTYISVMTAGVAPVQLRAVDVTHPAAAGPYWSTDGTALLFSDVPAGPGPAPATVIAAAGAARSGPTRTAARSPTGSRARPAPAWSGGCTRRAPCRSRPPRRR